MLSPVGSAVPCAHCIFSCRPWALCSAAERHLNDIMKVLLVCSKLYTCACPDLLIVLHHWRDD